MESIENCATLKISLFSIITFLLLLFTFRADEKFRKTLVTTVPLSDALLKILLQEEGNAISEASKSIQGATQKVVGVKDSIVGYFGDDKSAKSAEKPAPAKSMAPNATYIRFEIFLIHISFEWKIGNASSAVASPPLPSITAPKPTASSPPSESPAPKKAAPAAKPKVTEEKPQAAPKPSEPVKLPPVLTQPLPQT